jgi:long-chain acyl-CoA synthetase
MPFRERLSRLLREAPEKAEALEYHGVWWRWGQVQAAAARIHTVLATAGLGEGGRVGLVLGNRPEDVVALAGLLATGRCVVPLNPLQPPARLAADILSSELSAVVTGPAALADERVQAALTGQCLALLIDADGGVYEVGGRVPASHVLRPGIALEMATSGTTGPPKRIPLTDEQLDASLRTSGQIPRDGVLLAPTVSLVCTPLSHIGGLWAALGALHAGRRLVLLRKFEVEPWCASVHRHQVRAAFLVPAALRSLVEARVPQKRLSSLRLLTTGAAACPPELADAVHQRYGIPVLSTYGATEFAGAVAGWTTALHRRWWQAKASSAGRPYAGVQLRVLDASGAEVRPGRSGRLEVRSVQAATVERAGWVRTGDLARIDDDGFLWIIGRADDVIVRGGFKIQPEDIARALEEHPAVREAAIAALADTRLGALPVAAVEAVPGRPPPTPAELHLHCRDVLAPHERPARIVVLDALPRAAAGKVSRRDLLALFPFQQKDGEAGEGNRDPGHQ